MEIAIRVFIVLFVAVVVAAIVVFFARDIINDAKNNLDKIDDDADTYEQVLRVNMLSQVQYDGLLQECANMKSGIGNVECFVVRSANPISVVSPATAGGLSVIDTTSATPVNLFISYNVNDDSIYVED